MSSEELVPVSLDDDYYQGPGYTTGRGDYLVPRSRLERWEAAQAAYGEMQQDILRVMDEQRERVREISAQRPKTQTALFLERLYGPVLQATLESNTYLSKAAQKEPEDDTPLLVTDSKIDREEEERGL